MVPMSVSLLGTLALAVGAPGPKDLPPAPAVVGEWVAERRTFAGNGRPVSGEPLRYVFAADGTWAVHRGERKEPGDGRRYTTDPKKDPAEIDLTYLDSTAPDPRVLRGIYKIEGDTLTLCYGRRNGERPKSFESTADIPTTLWLFKRVKKD
jgi:uncharacterized protein (TIGR03067 family)